MKDFKVNIGGAWKDTDTMYCKIDGVWKTVSNVWTKIAGVWVECKGLKELVYKGAAGSMSYTTETRGSRRGPAEMPNYVVFPVGMDTTSRTVGAYNANLVYVDAPSLSSGTNHYHTGCVGTSEYAFMQDSSGGVSVFSNTSLTRSILSTLSSSRVFKALASYDLQVIFAGGSTSTSTSASTEVDSYNASLVKSTPTVLTESRRDAMGAGFNGLLLVAGGFTGSTQRSSMETYNSSLVKGSGTALSVGRSYGQTAVLNNHVLFVGDGRTVDAFNVSLVRTTLSQITATSTPQSLVSAEKDIAVFAGGHISFNISAPLTVVESYNENLVKATHDPMADGVTYSFNGMVGGYLLMAGGRLAGSSNSVSTTRYFEYK